MKAETAPFNGQNRTGGISGDLLRARSELANYAAALNGLLDAVAVYDRERTIAALQRAYEVTGRKIGGPEATTPGP